jgi:hypothetical protein
MLPSERRQFVLTHRTCIFGHARKVDGPSARYGKVSLCILDERWPFAYLQVYCDATIEKDPGLVVDAMMAVGGRMSGTLLPSDAIRTD